MALRCFYWNSRKVSVLGYCYLRISGRYNGTQFLHGNAGDIFNVDLIKFLYHENPENILKEGERILLVGSVLNAVKERDVLAGIGWKGNTDYNNFHVLNNCDIHGLRGPLTYEFLKKNGVYLEDVKFLLDPGLLIREVFGLNTEAYHPSDVIFIPHYREYNNYRKRRLPLGILLRSIDQHPLRLAKVILKAKLVYTSSLHVVIFCHALNRPCKLIMPQTKEPLFKYKDYFESVNLAFPAPLKSIDDVKFLNNSDSPVFIEKTLKDFAFPEKSHLRKLNLISYV